MAVFLFCVMCLVFGTTFFAIKVGLNEGFEPFMFAALRFLSAGLILVLWMRMKGKLYVPQSKRAWWDLFIVGLNTTGLCFAILYWSEKHLDSGICALISAAAPFMIAVLYAKDSKKPMPPAQIVGIILGLLGVAVLIAPSFQFDDGWVTAVFMLILLFGEFFYGFGSVRSTRLLSQGADGIAVNAYQSLFGGVILLTLSFLFESPIQHVSTSALASLVYLTLFGTILGMSIYYWLIKTTGPVFPAMWLYVSPLIAVVIGSVFLNEPIYWQTGVGALFILLGVYVTKSKRDLRGLPKMIRIWHRRTINECHEAGGAL